MDKLQAMKTFVRVVDAGSFSAVAHESDTTQSAVSKQVAALERDLGARLLTRTTRSLALTEEGEHYFEQARRLVAEIAEAEGALRRGEQQLTVWLRQKPGAPNRRAGESPFQVRTERDSGSARIPYKPRRSS